jgi:formylglycine-generating enzyme required for sulfatase activity/uncharacterized surface protein with fasciclin (FAS1) repeats
MTRATGQLCLAIVSVLLAGSAADGQTEPAPQQTNGLTTVLRNLWPRLAPSSTGNTEGAAPAQSRANPEDAVPPGEPPTAGVASPAPAGALNPAVAKTKIAAFLGRNCAACHGPSSVVPQFNVNDPDSLARKDKDYLVAGQPDRSWILKRVRDRRMPPPSKVRPLAEQDRSELVAWIDAALQPQPNEPQRTGKDIVATLRDDPQLTKLVELGEKAGVTKELEGGGPYTILAPTNEAFEGLNAQGRVPDETLWELLLNHGIAGKRSTEQLTKVGVVKSVGMKEFKVQRRDGALFIGDAKVLKADLACKNGVIHVIDRLLWLPPHGSYEGPAGIKMMMIPEGVFQMGSPLTDPAANGDERPPVPVKLSSFWLGETEVTRAQYTTLTDEDPSFNRLLRKVWPADEPVQNLTWIEAAEFCNKLSKAEGLQPYYDVRDGVKKGDAKDVAVPDRAGNGYRLPTEAEWEYACRAGSTGIYSFGNNPQLLNLYGVFKDGQGAAGGPQRVRGKLPNGLGLYDMHGNVQEWCQDWYDPSYQSPQGPGPLVDPTGPEKGKQKVYRGGSYLRPAKECRCAVRFSGDVLGTQDDFHQAGIGFRVARTLKGARSNTPPVLQAGDRNQR